MKVKTTEEIVTRYLELKDRCKTSMDFNIFLEFKNWVWVSESVEDIEADASFLKERIKTLSEEEQDEESEDDINCLSKVVGHYGTCDCCNIKNVYVYHFNYFDQHHPLQGKERIDYRVCKDCLAEANELGVKDEITKI